MSPPTTRRSDGVEGRRLWPQVENGDLLSGKRSKASGGLDGGKEAVVGVHAKGEEVAVVCQQGDVAQGVVLAKSRGSYDVELASTLMRSISYGLGKVVGLLVAVGIVLQRSARIGKQLLDSRVGAIGIAVAHHGYHYRMAVVAFQRLGKAIGLAKVVGQLADSSVAAHDKRGIVQTTQRNRMTGKNAVGKDDCVHDCVVC